MYPPSASVSLNWQKDILEFLDQIWLKKYEIKPNVLILLKTPWQQNFVKKLHRGRIWVNSKELLCYPYSLNINKCSVSCNCINDSYEKLCVPDVIKNISLKFI